MEKTAKKVASIARRYALQLVILFGSSVARKTHAESDVDIALLTLRPLSLHKELALRREFFVLFHREIDLVFLKRASPLLLGQIVRHGKLLAGDRKIFENFRRYAMKQYIDFQPYFRLREQTIRHTLTHSYAR